MNHSLSSRVVVAAFPGVVKGGIFVISVYLWTAQDITSVGNRAILEYLAEVLDALSGPWVIAADWQHEPDALIAAGVPAFLRGDVVAPRLSTCGAKVLDYFLVSSRLSHIVVGAQRIDDIGSRPHFGVRLVLASGGRQRSEKRLKAPRSLRDLPAGPRTDMVFTLPPAGDGSATVANLDVWYGTWISAVEEQAMTFVTSGGDALRGRARGHAVVSRCALGPPATPAAYQHHGARLWRRLAAWLQQLLQLLAAGACSERARHPQVQLTWNRTAMRVLGARHWRRLEAAELVRCRDAAADASAEPQVADVLSSVTASQLREAGVVRTLLATARTHLTRLTAAEARAADAGWRAWAVDGAACGGRAVHRWSRTPAGWAPSPLVREDPSDDSSLAIDATVPASPQQHVEAQADEWGGEWGVGLGLPAAAFPPLTTAPPRMRLHELIDAILSFPTGTALGTDRYHPRILLRLSPSLLVALTLLFGLCELLGQWPTVVTDVLIVLLAKPAGGFRPIGIFPTFVRVWFRARSRHIRAWNEPTAALTSMREVGRALIPRRGSNRRSWSTPGSRALRLRRRLLTSPRLLSECHTSDSLLPRSGGATLFGRCGSALPRTDSADACPSTACCPV
jgi:hypothetical protein